MSYTRHMKSFSYTYREKNGALQKGTQKAVCRSSVLDWIKAQGCTPVEVTETAAVSALPRKTLLAIGGGVALLVVVLVAMHLLSTDKAPVVAPAPDAGLIGVRPSLAPTVTPSATAPDTPAVLAATPATTPDPAPTSPPAAVYVRPAVAVQPPPPKTTRPERQPSPVAVAEPVEPEVKPPTPYKTMTDQSLAMILSIPPGASMPPLPDLQAVGMEEDLIKAMKTDAIVIEEQDSDEMILRKQEVDNAKQFLVAGVAQGLTPAEVLQGYVAEHNENADYRRDVVAAFQVLLREGKTSAEQFSSEMDRINAALVEYDLPPVTTEELGLR